MKFAKYLLKQMIPEWIKLYLNYKLLKTYLSSSVLIARKLKQLRRDIKYDKNLYFDRKQQIIQQEEVIQKVKGDLEGFCLTIKEETLKIESFIIWKYQDLQKKNQKIQEQVKIMKKQKEIYSLNEYMGDKQKAKKQQQKFSKQQYVLKQTIYQFYIEVIQYQNFINLNHQGLIKILKKYKKCTLNIFRDKLFEKEVLGEIMKDILILKQLPDKCQTILNSTERLLLNNFYQLNPKKGRYNLRKYKEAEKIESFKGKDLFQFGLFIGFSLVLITFILLLRFDGYLDADNQSNEHSIFQKMFPCFRGLALFIVYYWYLGLDLWGWTHFRINYKIYLGFNHHFSTVSEVFRRVSYFSTFFLISFILYSLQAENLEPFKYHESYTKYIPMFFWIILISYVFIPFTTIMNGPGRVWMYRLLGGAIYGHFIKYESRFTFCLDQFISMATPLRDLDYTICYYKTLWQTGEIHDGKCFYQKRLTGALIVIIPYSMKAIHYITRARDKGKFWHTDEMWNFFKTLLAVCVATLSYLAKKQQIFRIIWIPTAAFCSLFQYWWDLKKDWLFFEEGSNVRFLRNDLGYNHPCIYYIIGISNFFLRLTWMLSLSPDMYLYFGLRNKELFIFIIGFLEMTRRLINNFIKIEKEYITNLRSLKTTRDYQYPFQSKDQIPYQMPQERLTLSVLNMNEQTKYDDEILQLLRVTSNYIDRSELNKSQEMFNDCKIDMEILEKAKKQEKFQQSKIKQLKQENILFKQKIETY